MPATVRAMRPGAALAAGLRVLRNADTRFGQALLLVIRFD
jgi:hypothetical protein